MSTFEATQSAAAILYWDLTICRWVVEARYERLVFLNYAEARAARNLHIAVAKATSGSARGR